MRFLSRFFSRLFCHIDRTYTSELDHFLSDLHQKNELSQSQRQVRRKYDRLTKLRDTVDESKKSTVLWDKF